MRPENPADIEAFEQSQARAADQVEACLQSWLARRCDAGTPARLADAMRHAALGGGKRFRAFLVMETTRICAGDAQGGLDVAAALECVHAYSLVHDDLPAMDNDELRRGRPTVWKAFDEWTAILAGDALLTLAFEIIATSRAIAPAAALALVRQLAIASGRSGMVGGQILDLEAEKLNLPETPDVAHIARLQAMKTGALVGFACAAGPLIGQASPAIVDALGRYGRALGEAFQISDDILDAEGDATVVGKAVGKDRTLGKATLGTLLGSLAARQKLADVVANAIGALEPFGPDAEPLRQAATFMLGRQR